MENADNEKLLELVTELFTLEARQGHLKWKVSDLARNCKVSRTLVYYHLGRSKIEILLAALDIVAAEFYGLSSDRTEMVRSGSLYDSLRHTRGMFLKTPALTIFYITWSRTESEIQKKLLNMEARYRQRLQSLFPHLSANQVFAIQTVFHGIVTSPHLEDKVIKEIIGWLPLKAGV